MLLLDSSDGKVSGAKGKEFEEIRSVKEIKSCMLVRGTSYPLVQILLR